MKARIISTGGYYPDYKLSNSELIDYFGIDAWLLEQLGIENRYWATNPKTLNLEETQADMLFKASLKALEEKSLDSNIIDLLVVSSTVPDYSLPTTATILQEKLEIHECNSVQIHAGCVGAIQALDFAVSQILTGKIETALVASSNLMSTYWANSLKNDEMDSIDDQLNLAMFSDSASAIIVQKSEDKGIECVFSGSQGIRIPKGIYLDMGGAVYPGNEDDFKNNRHKWKQKPKLITKHGSNLSKIALEKLLELNKFDPLEIDYYIFPQANPSLLKNDMEILSRSGFPIEKVVSVVENKGNSATASLFHVLDQLNTENKLEQGTKVVIIGGEASKWLYGGVLLEW